MSEAFELCILFMHHRDDALTRAHYEKTRRANPTALIVAVCDSPESALPGAFDVATVANRWGWSSRWRNCDTLMLRWFEHRGDVTAKKYAVLEYDVWCDVDLRDYFRAEWDADSICRSFPVHERDAAWPWFEEMALLEPEDRPFAAGLWPLGCAVWSHEGLARMVAVATTVDVFSELRIGTAVRRAGLSVKLMSPTQRARVHYKEYAQRITEPGVYHAVKRLDHNRSRKLYAARAWLRDHTSAATRARVAKVVERVPWLKRLLLMR